MRNTHSAVRAVTSGDMVVVCAVLVLACWAIWDWDPYPLREFVAALQ